MAAGSQLRAREATADGSALPPDMKTSRAQAERRNEFFRM
jgi:hypothetical protein